MSKLSSLANVAIRTVVVMVVVVLLVICYGVVDRVANENERLVQENERLVQEKALVEADLVKKTKNLDDIKREADEYDEEQSTRFDSMLHAYEVVPSWLLSAINFGVFPELPEIEAGSQEELYTQVLTNADGYVKVRPYNSRVKILEVTWPNLVTALVRSCGYSYGCSTQGSIDRLVYLGSLDDPKDQALVNALVAVAEDVSRVNQLGYVFNEKTLGELLEIVPKDGATKTINKAWTTSSVDLAAPLSGGEWDSGHFGFEGFFRRRHHSNPALIHVYRAWIALAAHKYELEGNGQMLAEAVAGLERTTTLDPAQKRWLLSTLRAAQAG